MTVHVEGLRIAIVYVMMFGKVLEALPQSFCDKTDELSGALHESAFVNAEQSSRFEARNAYTPRD